jgi:hypothetical protein
MTMLRSLIVRVVLVMSLPVATASGQRLMLDVGAQAWTGRANGHVFSNHGGPSLDGVVAWRPTRDGAFIVGGGLAGHAIMSEACYFPPGTSGCASNFPSFSSFTAFAGLATSGAGARLLGGPGVFHAGERGTALGIQARTDLAATLAHHVAFVLSARGAVIPNFEGRVHRYGAFGLGIGIR